MFWVQAVVVMATNCFDRDYSNFCVCGRVRILGFAGMADTVCGGSSVQLAWLDFFVLLAA